MKKQQQTIRQKSKKGWVETKTAKQLALNVETIHTTINNILIVIYE